MPGKNRMAKDHLFLLYGIINSVTNGDESSIEISVSDMKKHLIKLNLEETMNYLVDTLPHEFSNDKVSLIYESNKKTMVSINTPFGATERK